MAPDTMTPKKILVLQAHPDASTPHLLHSLASAYAEGATTAGHAVRQVDLASLDVPLLRDPLEWEHGSVPAPLAQAQALIGWCDHLVVFYPLWMGDMPALLKAFLEQVMRPGFASLPASASGPARKGLKGRSARVVVAMGMPAFIYRWFYGAHSLRSLERNILGFVGFSPVRHTLVGSAATLTPQAVAKWQQRLARLGAGAA